MKINNKELKGLLKSFSYAFRGLWFCIKNERNMRIHLVSSVVVLLFAFVYGIDATQYMLLIITLAIVITCEVLNTAIEALVDLGANSYNSIARVAKDVAAGAVLVSAIGAVGIGLVLFLHPGRLAETLERIIANPIYIIVFVIILAFGLIFIFRGIKPIERKDNIKIYVSRPAIINIENDSIDETDVTKIYTGRTSSSATGEKD